MAEGTGCKQGCWWGGGWGELGQAGRQNLNAALELDPAKAAYNQQIGTIASTFR